MLVFMTSRLHEARSLNWSQILVLKLNYAVLKFESRNTKFETIQKKLNVQHSKQLNDELF